MASFDEDEFLALGHELRGNKTWQRRRPQAQLDEFKSVYGTHPRVLALIWQDLQSTPHDPIDLATNAQPKYLLVTYRWLWSYESETALKTNYGSDEKTIRKWCNYFVKKVALLRKIKVRLLLGRCFFLCCCRRRSYLPLFLDRSKLGG